MHWLILLFLGMKTNVACAPCVESSTASSDALNRYSTEATQKKDAHVAYITSPDAAVLSVKGFYILF